MFLPYEVIILVIDFSDVNTQYKFCMLSKSFKHYIYDSIEYSKETLNKLIERDNTTLILKFINKFQIDLDIIKNLKYNIYFELLKNFKDLVFKFGYYLNVRSEFIYRGFIFERRECTKLLLTLIDKTNIRVVRIPFSQDIDLLIDYNNNRYDHVVFISCINDLKILNNVVEKQNNFNKSEIVRIIEINNDDLFIKLSKKCNNELLFSTIYELNALNCFKLIFDKSLVKSYIRDILSKNEGKDILYFLFGLVEYDANYIYTIIKTNEPNNNLFTFFNTFCDKVNTEKLFNKIIKYNKLDIFVLNYDYLDHFIDNNHIKYNNVNELIKYLCKNELYDVLRVLMNKNPGFDYDIIIKYCKEHNCASMIKTIMNYNDDFEEYIIDKL
jgi:hypothetical protein